MRMANEFGKKTIYDLDDWILDLPQYSVTNLTEDTLANIISMLREATHVTVSNMLLAEKLKVIRRDTHLILNGFDHEEMEYQPKNWHEVQPPKILLSNTDSLKLVNFRKEFIESIRCFLEKHKNLTLEFWGDDFPEMNSITQLKPMGFRPNYEYKIAIRDAGYLFAIVPLGGVEDPDTLLFNSCKSCIKYIDFGSLGIPAIYSLTPVYSSVVRHRQTGLLAANNAENWQQQMQEMYSNQALRQRIRINSYCDVRARFNLVQPASMMTRLLI
jgi:hypothetical protein